MFGSPTIFSYPIHVHGIYNSSILSRLLRYDQVLLMYVVARISTRLSKLHDNAYMLYVDPNLLLLARQTISATGAQAATF